MRRMFSARELAEMDLPGVPSTLPRASDLITRVRASSPDLVAKRSGRGGGYVIDLLALPPEAQAEIARREKVAQIAAQDEADALEADKRQMVLRASADLTGRQRQVMEARAVVLRAIEAIALTTNISRRAAILAFLDAATDARIPSEELKALKIANDKGGRANIPSRATIYGWFAARDARGVIALAPELTRQKADLPAWFDGFLKVYGRPSKPSIAEAVREFSLTLPEGEPKPTEKQARTALAKLPVLARIKGREGRLAMRTRLAYTARDFSDLLPTSVYSADGKTFDTEIAHPIHGQPFRPEITTIVDVATRRIVGWSAALDENTFAVVDALRRACEIGGIPAIFYTDRGPGYRNHAMDDTLTGFLGRAGITPMRALPYNSQAKGVIERINQIYTATAKTMPTYIGKDMDKEAKLFAFKTTRKELALTGTSTLLPTWQHFINKMEEAIESYNNRPHSELPKVIDQQLGRKRHMTPNELWAQKSQGFEAIMPDAAELDDMFRPYVVRRTRRALVDWLGNSYFHLALEPYHGQDVLVGYDIHDATKVWVREIDQVEDGQAPAKLIAVAVFEGHATRYVPLSYEKAAMEKRQKGRLARVEKKADVIRQELRPSVLLEHTPSPVFEISEPAAPAPLTPPPAQLVQPKLAEASPDARPIFRDDVSFAGWIAAHPDRVTEADRAYLRDLLTDHSTKELLRMSGLDLDALQKLLRTQT